MGVCVCVCVCVCVYMLGESELSEVRKGRKAEGKVYSS